MKKSILARMAAAENRGDDLSGHDSAEKALQSRRHSSPVISNVGRVLSQLTEDSIISLDPSKVERSPFQDRFDSDEEAEKELEALKVSILSEGQKIPVLVRPHPTKSDYYQLAYGYRRWLAIKSIMTDADRPETIKIKAYIRELTDRQLIEEQSLENGVRENLTWIEQAMWAVRLKSTGLSQRAICPILGLTEAAVSHLFRVTEIIPEDIIFAIGRAKGVGRPKWTALAELLKKADRLEDVRQVIQSQEFRQSDSAARVGMAMLAASGKATTPVNRNVEGNVEFVRGETVIARMRTTRSGTTLVIPQSEEAFAHWLGQRMPDLVREYGELLDPS